MSSQRFAIRNRDGSVAIDTYCVLPQRTPAPAILLLQEIFGVNSFMRRTADRLAALGYLVMCPDLFWRQQRNVELDPALEADREKGMGLYKAMSESLAVADCTRALERLRGMPECTGKVAAMGFCMGGKLAYLMATRTNVDASVAYYGVGIQNALDEASRIGKPLLLHLAADDSLCPPQAQQQIVAALDPLAALAQVWIYERAGHAFARSGGPNFQAEAAALADDRTRNFLQAHL
jgi:carboxymethylenebutenolidase